MSRVAWLLVAVATTAAAQAPAPTDREVWRIDPDQTRIHFEVLHFGTSTLRGRFDTIAAAITLNRAARRGAVSVTVDTASVSTGIAPLDAALRGPDLLAAQAHPQAWFVASGLRFDDAGRLAALDGELTLRGTSRPLSLHARRFACRADATRGREVCGGDFDGELRRSDFGMPYGLPFVADRVRLVVQVEAVRD